MCAKWWKQRKKVPSFFCVFFFFNFENLNIQCSAQVLFCYFFSFLPTWKSSKPILFTQLISSVQKKNCLLCPPNPKSQFSSQVIVTTDYNSHFGQIKNVNNINQYWFERTPKQGKVNFYNTDHVPVTSWAVMCW